MIVLGIETSCDETSAAIVRDGVYVLAHETVSSLKEHSAFGGIIPEIASRRQMEYIRPVVAASLQKARLTLKQINSIGVTSTPGLIGSLLVGLCFARGLARALQKPLREIDHIQAHLYANFLRRPGESSLVFPALPAVGLVVSGGHTSLFDVRNFQDIRLLGQTKDDAAGEAFDKVGRILGLGYPGGPLIDRLAKKGRNADIRFPQAVLKNSFDFSFSGVKTAVLYYVRKHQHEKSFSLPKVAYAFQESLVSTLVEKSLAACQSTGANTILVGGGVAANSVLRSRLVQEGQTQGITVHFPPLEFCLDNAAMIAGLSGCSL